MKKYLLILFVGFTGFTNAQQLALNSQYLYNEMLVNPGATGIKEYVPIQLSFRKQWVGLAGSPTTQALSAHGKIAGRMGIGGTVFNDVSGPSRRTGVSFNTAYHLRLDANNDHQLGVGIGVSFTQHAIDENQLDTYLPDDPAITRGFNNQFVPDANAGIFYHFKDKGYVGISGFNLVEMNRDLFDFQTVFSNPLVRTYYLFGGYNFDLGKNFGLNLSTLGQVIETGTYQFDGTMVFEYRDIVSLGGSYRHNDAVVFMLGAKAGPMKIGYAYDYTLSDIGNYSFGSHEIFLELQLSKEKGNNNRTPWLKRNRIYSPH